MIPEALKHIDPVILQSRHTIEFSLNESLAKALDAKASEAGTTSAALVLDMVQDGLADFREAIRISDPDAILDQWRTAARSFAGPAVKWSFVASRRTVIKLQVTAKEYEVSISDLVEMFLAKWLEFFGAAAEKQGNELVSA
jgi:hypothetical protein